MPNYSPSVIHIAIVGGGKLCKELLEKTTFDYTKEEVFAPIIAVADTDPEAPGMVLADELGLLTFTDYHQLYDARFNIHLIILLTSDERILEDILSTRPSRIRVMAYHVFNVFWRAIGLEERKLRDQYEQMATVLNGIQEFILVITPESVIVDVNEAFLKSMDYTRDEVIGRKCYEVYQRSDYPCDQREALCPLKKAIRNRSPSQQIRPRLGSDGKLRHLEVTVYPIWEKDGKISKFIEISRDITKRKKEEEEITQRLEQMVKERTRQLKDSQDKLLHQDKMASLGKLSASVVHEINNPIAGILNLTMLMKRIVKENPVDKKKDFEQFVQYLDLMEAETRRISRIVSNLLAFSRESKPELKKVNINRLIEKTLFLNSNLLKINGVKVEKRLYSNLPEIIGSEDQLQQVFMNIISNAAETLEIAGGGRLSIETRYLTKSKRISASFKDSGIAIPRENVSKIFEPFFTTKKKGKGVGLGLSVAYGIVREHGGTIFVEPGDEKGNTFTVRLPLKRLAMNLDPNGGPHG